MERLRKLLIEDGWTPPVHEQLCSILAGPPGVACFDWDETCASGDLGEFLLKMLDANGEKWAEYERLISKGFVPAAYAQAAMILAGKTREAAALVCSEAVDLAISSASVVIRPEISALIGAFQLAGWDVWVVTASTPYVVEEAALKVGVERERVLGMRLAVVDGLYTKAIDGPVCYGPGKVDAIMRAIGQKPDFAAGDTWTDLEMFNLLHTRWLLVIGSQTLLR